MVCSFEVKLQCWSDTNPRGTQKGQPQRCVGVWLKRAPPTIVLHVWCKYYCVCPLSGIEVSAIQLVHGLLSVIRYIIVWRSHTHTHKAETARR